MTKKLFAFVLMPFDKSFDDLYRYGIKQAAETAGIIAERVDEQIYHDEKILERIYNQIDAADFIIADMTGRNPNVFYEVGYAHAKGKRCILLTAEAADIPFDLKHHRHIVYGGSIQSLQTQLAKELAAVAKDVTSPIIVTLNSVRGDLEKSAYLANGVVTFKFDVNNPSSSASPEIDHVYLYTGTGWSVSQDKFACPNTQSDLKDFHLRHLIRISDKRLQKGGWTQINLVAKKLLGSKIKGDNLKDSYSIKGVILLNIVTNQGTFDFQFNISVECDEIPF